MSSFKQTMLQVADDQASDHHLQVIVDNNTRRTQQLLQAGAQDNAKFEQYIQLQQQMHDNANGYLKDSQTAYQQFMSLVKHPSGTGARRLARTLTFGLYKPKVTPVEVAGALMDLYHAQVEHQGAVQTNHDLLQHRREMMYDIAKDAAVQIRDHTVLYEQAQKQLAHLEQLKNTLDGFTQTQHIDPQVLDDQLAICTDAGLFDGTELIARLREGDDVTPDLYVVKQDVDLTFAKKKG